MPVAASPVTAAKAPVRSEVGLSAHAMKLWLAAAQYRRPADPRRGHLAVPEARTGDRGGWKLRQPGRGDPVRHRGDPRHPRARRPRISPEPGGARIYPGTFAVSSFVAIGIVAAVAGVVLLAIAIRRLQAQEPKHVAMLIGGMMLTAFGIVIAGFSLAYDWAEPIDFNSEGATR